MVDRATNGIQWEDGRCERCDAVMDHLTGTIKQKFPGGADAVFLATFIWYVAFACGHSHAGGHVQAVDVHGALVAAGLATNGLPTDSG